MKTPRSLLRALPLLLLLAGTVPGSAAEPVTTRPAADPATLAVPAARAESATATAAAPGGRKDLTVFFSVGVIADLLLVGAFVVWAVRQWRKSG